MAPNTRDFARVLHDAACHAEAAETRLGARDILDAMARQEGYAHVGALLDACELDVDLYYGSLSTLR